MAAHPRRIVVGYDGSGTSQRALVAAADLVGYGSTLTVVSAHPAGAPSGQKAIDEAREHLLRRQVSAFYLEPFGEPADEIVSAARALDADLVVVGRAQRAEFETSQSVSAEVLRRAPCDVLVVR